VIAPGFTRYRSHKVVEAAPIAAAELKADGSGKVAIGDGTVIEVPPGFQRKPGDLLSAVESTGAVLVRYSDGYLSWSPRAAFLEGYTPEPEDWRARLIVERDDLAARLFKLRQFLASPAVFEVPDEAHDLLRAQQYRMGQLCVILDARIKLSAA
jgi:hypothetical protein